MDSFKLFGILIGSLVFFFCIFPARFAAFYTYIEAKDIILELEPAYSHQRNVCITTVTLKDSNIMYPDESPNEKSATVARRLSILPGGQWKPINCQSLYNVAIILPYRNRQDHLKIFINYIHPFLQLQQLEYRIFVIEQSAMKQFNRAKLFNVGFIEATKISDFHCFIFHDIDLIPQNKNNIYSCTKMPRHMSTSVNTFRYTLPYVELFGGAVALTTEQFKKVNGYSNTFFGWGGEDDDFYSRLFRNGLQISRFGPSIAQYYMLSHFKETPSELRFDHLSNGPARFDFDGINNIEYKVLNYQLKPLYSWILVDL